MGRYGMELGGEKAGMSRTFLRFFLVLLLGLFAMTSHAATLTVDLSSTSLNAGSNTLVWNLGNATLHPPLFVENYNNSSGNVSVNFDVGDGSDGAFNSTTYAQFSQNGDLSGNIIRLDTDQYTELNVTQFTLDAGWTLQPVGSGALILRSQTTVVIHGTINCSGNDGDAISADFATTTSGGTGRCGGGSGGAGGSSTESATAGSSGGTSISGGNQGTSQTASGGDGGGGGGGYTGAAFDATNGVRPPAGTGGTKGTRFEDNDFSITGGGSGGGGGAVYTGADTANRSSGGGGGAGGGVIHIFAVGDITVGASGAVRANGGNGGGTSGTFLAGAGGGGAGGSILMFSAGSISFSGAVTATKGGGGSSNGGNGGNGSQGRTWITDGDGVASGVAESPASLLLLFGNVGFRTGSFSASTLTLDTLSTKPNLSSFDPVVANSTSGSLALSLATSEDESFSQGVSFISSDQLLGQNVERYNRVSVSLTNTSTTAPYTLQSLTISYQGLFVDDFEFKSTCGQVLHSPPPSSQNGGAGLILIPMLLLFLLRRNKHYHY